MVTQGRCQLESWNTGYCGKGGGGAASQWLQTGPKTSATGRMCLAAAAGPNQTAAATATKTSAEFALLLVVLGPGR